MTTSQITYSALLLGSPNRALKVRGGTVTLDESGSPHVTSRLEIAIPGSFVPGAIVEDPLADGYGEAGYGEANYGGALQLLDWVTDEALLAALDTRLSPPPRIRLSITPAALDSTLAVSRTFDLTLRDREVRHADGIVTLTLASDEALLSDYAPLEDDLGPFAHQSSLRGVVNYGLSKIGATLQPGTLNPDVTTYTDATNMVIDPRVTNLANFPDYFNCSRDYDTVTPGAIGAVPYNGIRLYSPTSQDSFIALGGDVGALRLGMSAGRTYTFSMRGQVIAAIGNPGTNARRLGAYYRVGTGPYQSVLSPQVSATVGQSSRVSVTFTLPEGTTEAFIRAFHGGTSGVMTWGHPRLSETDPRPGADNTDMFSGATPDTTGYDYAWEGAAEMSRSTRRALIDRSPEVLFWPAGRDALNYLVPIVQSFGLRLVCNERRQWTLRDESYSAPGALSIRHGVNLIDGTDAVSREDDTWFDAAVTVWKWTDRDDVQRTVTDSYALPGSTRVRRFEFERPYPGAGFSAYAVRRAQGRGRIVTATSVIDGNAQAEQPISIVLQGAPTQTGQTSRIDFDLDRDEMTVTTRTVDTPFGAIDLATGTIDQATGTIDQN
ncbi:hypothetical protein [Microbacterium testaceum]|uniref:hypothetical protein n=1 Tax=Microbacterium testaceum TaxID=2033 RepID=UPI002AC70131|nr:hypothetical protein [Microbacterium testaceum]MDZ5145331.1 hypothetical protein [Microbacterium testaceum]